MLNSLSHQINIHYYNKHQTSTNGSLFCSLATAGFAIGYPTRVVVALQSCIQTPQDIQTLQHSKYLVLLGDHWKTFGQSNTSLH